MPYESFRELRVWQEAKALAVQIYALTGQRPFSRDFGLVDQVRRAAVSIPSNVAEGYERQSSKEFVRFLLMAKGSLSELRTQLEIAREVGLIGSEAYLPLEAMAENVSRMLGRLIRVRRDKGR